MREVVVRPLPITLTAPAPSPLATAPAAFAAVTVSPTAAITAPAPLATPAMQPTAATAPGTEATPALSAATDRSQPPPAALADAPIRPKLLNRIDPEFNQRMLDDIGRNAVVLVDLTIRSNGTVAAVAPQGLVPRAMQRALVAAMEQWRFEPLPQQRVHRIELVFNTDP